MSADVNLKDIRHLVINLKFNFVPKKTSDRGSVNMKMNSKLPSALIIAYTDIVHFGPKWCMD